jgi:23S rRNA pseudouridine1911/1915/1917 synthase
MAVSRRGKEARTRYRVEQRFGTPAPSTLLTATLETGRTHQIRVHLSAIGHPVVCDPVYARGRTLPGGTISRPFLHAFSLGLEHPRTGVPVSWESELPADLRDQLAALSE